jgi:hypothetical protein
MYRNTKSGALQDSDKKYFIKRKIHHLVETAYQLVNVPPGSVVVTAAGRILVEGSTKV